jgi:polar amino acid transport system substrate-binding protein
MRMSDPAFVLINTPLQRGGVDSLRGRNRFNGFPVAMTSPSYMPGMRCLVGWFLLLAICGAPFAVAEQSPLERIKKARALTVCIDPDNLPYSHSKKTPPGFDVEIARELAKALGVEAKFVWVDTIRDTPLGEMLEGECDCVVGAAIDVNTADEMQNLGEKVLFTKPYHTTGYVLVIKEGGPQAKKLEELKGKKIGAEAGSVADYNLNLKGHDRRLYPMQDSIFSGIESGEVVAGFMWAPNVGFMLKEDPKRKFKLVDGYVPEEDFRFDIGVAVRKEDRELKESLDKIIQSLVEKGEVKRIITGYGAPYFPPL